MPLLGQICCPLSVKPEPLVRNLTASDAKFGRRPILRYSALATAAVVYPVFWLVNTGSPVLLTIVITLYTALVMIAGPTVMVVFLSERFDTDVRYTGTSLVYQFAQMLGSGFSR